ncbi:MAG: Uma2 family endonuclease [Planctomycetales bacterium]|nr:Uma2 family endonuclease [Planctomycetales bacterium]
MSTVHRSTLILNAAIGNTMAERLMDLGDLPSSRIRMDPPPGTADLDDVIRANDHSDRICEWVDRTLVEKAVGWQESLLAMVLGRWLGNFLESNDLGAVIGPDGMYRIFADTARAPDISFISWERLPDGRLPTEPVPAVVPDFAIEILSIGNTRSEMARKRREYFHAGVRLLWIVDPRARSVAIFTASDQYTVVDENATIDGGSVLPGWSVDLSKLFAELDRRAPDARS